MSRPLPLLAQGVAVVIWSTTFVVSSDALASILPALLTVIRFGVAALILLPLAAARPGMTRTLASPMAATLGLTGVAAYYGLENLGLLTTTAGTAALLQAIIPVSTAALSFVMLRERLGIGSILGLALATVGVVIAANTGAQFNLGAVLIALGAVAYAVYTVLLRRLEGSPRVTQARAMSTDPLIVAAATAVWGLIFLLPRLIGEIASGQVRLVLSGPAVFSALYLGVFASGATLLLWTYGSKRTPAVTSGILTAAIPALGYGFALAAGEAPTWNKTIGGLLALLGVTVAILSSRTRSLTEAEPTPQAKYDRARSEVPATRAHSELRGNDHL